MKRLATLVGVSLAMGLGLSAGAGEAAADDDGKKGKTRIVDCTDPEDSVQKAVDKAKPGKATTIVIQGVCTEDVTVDVDDLTLKGGATGGTVSGTITIVGARRVVIDDLTVTGSGDGIVGTDTASFTVRNATIDGNDASGIRATRNSSAVIKNSQISDNGQVAEFGWQAAEGIRVVDGASGLITHNQILNNRGDGVWVGDNGFARIHYNAIDGNGRSAPWYESGIEVGRAVARSKGNTVVNSGYAAVQVGALGIFHTGVWVPSGTGTPDPADKDVYVQKGCTAGGPVGCGDPDTAVFDVYRSGQANLRNTDVTGEINISAASMLAVRTSRITGNINAWMRSGVQLRSSVTFTGTLNCGADSYSFGPVACGQTVP